MLCTNLVTWPCPQNGDSPVITILIQDGYILMYIVIYISIKHTNITEYSKYKPTSVEDLPPLSFIPVCLLVLRTNAHSQTWVEPFVQLFFDVPPAIIRRVRTQYLSWLTWKAIIAVGPSEVPNSLKNQSGGASGSAVNSPHITSWHFIHSNYRLRQSHLLTVVSNQRRTLVCVNM